LAGEVGELTIARPDAQQGLRFVEKAVVVADEIEHDQLLFVIGLSQTTTQLLQEKNPGFCGP
jgi:hypothetical protein